MLSTIYLEKKKGFGVKNIYQELKKYHKSNFFIKIHPINKEIGTENVINTNFCEISVCNIKSKNKIMILSAIDNLMKGAAGQAVQNMNALFDLKEHTGIK